MQFLGDGKLIALLDGQNIQYICEYGMPSFLGLTTGLSLQSDYHSGRIFHLPKESADYQGSLRLIDFIENGCFVRYAESTCSHTFNLLIPPYCHAYQYPDLKHNRQNQPCLLLRIPSGTPTADGACSTRECYLLITILGNGGFFDNGHAIRLHPGRTVLLFCTGTADSLQQKLSACIGGIEHPLLQKSALYENAVARCKLPFALTRNQQTMWDTLMSLTSHTGAVLGGHGENCALLADAAPAGQAYLYMGKTEIACQIAKFLLSQYETGGYLPLRASPGIPFPTAEKTGREVVHYPAICHFFLDLCEKGVKNNLTKRLRIAVFRMFSEIEAASSTGSVGFSGFEFIMRRGMLPADRLLYGNALAAAQYLSLAKRIGKTTPETFRKALKQYALDFEKDGFPIIANRNRLGRMRLPKAVYGPCPACGELPYVGWLFRAEFGSYLCPRCLETGLREWIGKEDARAFPGTYSFAAELLCSAGLRTEDERNKAVENCLRMIDENVSFYDLCLLAAVLYRIGSPHYAAIMARLNTMLQARVFPFYAAEAAVYLLAQPPQGYHQ